MPDTNTNIFSLIFELIGVKTEMKLNRISGTFLLLGSFFQVHWLLPLVHAYYSDQNAVEGEENTRFRLLSFKAGENVRLRLDRALFASAPNQLVSVSILFVLLFCVASLAQSEVFQMFFSVMFISVCVTAWHALVFLPAVFLFVPPAPSQTGRNNTIEF